MKRFFAAFVAVLLFALCVSGCAPSLQSARRFTVMIEQGEAFVVTDGYTRAVEAGGEATFRIRFREEYVYGGNNVGATFADGILTFSNVRSDTMIVIDAFPAGSENGRVEREEGEWGIRYTAFPDEGYVFCGWVQGPDGQAEIYSYSNGLTVEKDAPALRAVFLAREGNTFVTYHANGGVLPGSEETQFCVPFASQAYLYPAAIGSRFFDYFEREGYIPLEYNTAPDGSGAAVSLGSRILADGAQKDLYVIWARETGAEDFLYECISPKEGVSGVALRRYLGSAETVVVPEEIGGLPVVRIGAECFLDCSVKTVVLSRNVRSVADGAFVRCDALETLCLCDSLAEIGDDSFVDCPNLANLRVNAVTPPVHGENQIASLVRRVEELYASRGSEKSRLLFYGGSAMYNGIDGGTIDRFFEGTRNVLNLGQNANICGMFMLDLYADFLREGDALVFAPEYWLPLYDRTWHMVDWIAIEFYYDALRLIDLRDYEGVFDAYSEYQLGSANFAFEGKQKMQPGSYEDFSTGFDEYFTRDYVAEADLSRPLGTGTLDVNALRPYLSNIEEVYTEEFLPRGAELFFSFAPLYAEAYGANRAEFDGYFAWVQRALTCPILGEPTYFWYPRAYFYDSPVHLTTEGAVHNSSVYCTLLTSSI